MDKVKGIALMFNFFLILGIVGGVERNTIELLNGFWFCMALNALNFIILRTIKEYRACSTQRDVVFCPRG